ncbi:uncharacterized protein UDID_05294 [Ustilago sp. UG-2017a]|nr:uncharacterized protein UDID_05294 [Ustilago sp. UG-2017a]
MRHPLPQPPLRSAAASNDRSSRYLSHVHNHCHYNSYSSYASASPESFAPASPYYSSSHPSPASTISSSGAGSSSLCTPPDLLVNGSSAAALQVHNTAASSAKSSSSSSSSSSFSSSFSSSSSSSSPHHHLTVNSWNGLAVKPRLPSRNMNAEEIKRRKRLLSDLPSLPLFQLPSPPPSPKYVGRSERGEEQELNDVGGLARKRVRASRSPSPPTIPTIATTTPRIIARTGSLAPSALTTLAASYRTAARQLKHTADARACSLSSSRPSYLAARPTELSALQQLDAVLLFCYAFWLDDLASCSCIAKNWISLFGLLRYATNAQSDLGNDVLLGICRLIESAVLRKLHRHDSSILLRKLSSSTSPTERFRMEEMQKLIEQQHADLERSDRLATQSCTLLSIHNLSTTYPDLLQKALSSTIPNNHAAADMVDPSKHPNCSHFAFPLDPLSQVPHWVAFGRCAVREHALLKQVEYELVQVDTS